MFSVYIIQSMHPSVYLLIFVNHIQMFVSIHVYAQVQCKSQHDLIHKRSRPSRTNVPPWKSEFVRTQQQREQHMGDKQ